MEAARFFPEVAAQNRMTEEMRNRMAQIEHQGDNVAHTIIEQRNKTFITPFDREDTRLHTHVCSPPMKCLIVVHRDIARAVCLDAPSPDRRIRLFLCVVPYQQAGVE